MWRWLFIIVVIFFGWRHCSTVELHYAAPQQVIDNAPQQSKASGLQPVPLEDYAIQPVAEFILEARVLSRKDYWFGREADLSPTDLVLGWGEMANPLVLKQINIRQSGRWYFWQVESFPIPRRSIETQSANMHLIPANDEVARTLKHIRPGQLITLQGYLVNVNADDGWRWSSSLTREDTGANACELIYVKQLKIIS
ncbi:hypothetical protein [Methylophaga pinxianii]|uniref:hypothetical protein n=1 Tax=Methylophaga pinxianii TaxID=2881052 RepID=UPI001CF2DE56|nr:hypothetical protein [Methylophaga pinxianii]MCB2425713.1 hypothetical protein [Methylophaga pinxianii]UPH45729.1 hypothetical protein LGT42_000160 [Methylophaga pinxianii]